MLVHAADRRLASLTSSSARAQARSTGVPPTIRFPPCLSQTRSSPTACSAMSGSSRSKSVKRGAQELEAQATPSGYTCDEVPAEPVPLKTLIAEAVQRWFEDTLVEAQRGDVKQQALLGQMYEEGYGCKRNPRAAREWTERAELRGYRMKGVYCEL